MKCSLCLLEFDDKVKEDGLIVQELYGGQDKEILKDIHICQECAKKERIRVAVEKFTPLFDNIFNAVNRSEIREEQITAIVFLINRMHRTIQNDFMMVIQRILYEYGKGSGNAMYEDPRNQWALTFAKKAGQV